MHNIVTCNGYITCTVDWESMKNFLPTKNSSMEGILAQREREREREKPASQPVYVSKPIRVILGKL